MSETETDKITKAVRDFDPVVRDGFGGFETCVMCGTSFDSWAVDPLDMLMVGDGCAFCMKEIDEDPQVCTNP